MFHYNRTKWKGENTLVLVLSLIVSDIESSRVVGNNIGLKDLVEVSKEGNENEEMTSTDSSKVEDNELEEMKEIKMRK